MIFLILINEITIWLFDFYTRTYFQCEILKNWTKSNFAHNFERNAEWNRNVCCFVHKLMRGLRPTAHRITLNITRIRCILLCVVTDVTGASYIIHVLVLVLCTKSSVYKTIFFSACIRLCVLFASIVNVWLFRLRKKKLLRACSRVLFEYKLSVIAYYI